ncbi:hypothetical protein GGR57DRAFT_520629, partial [Xylariaceae sp. FL1272]
SQTALSFTKFSISLYHILFLFRAPNYREKVTYIFEMKFSASVLTTILALSTSALAVPTNSNGRDLNSHTPPKPALSRKDLSQLLSKGFGGGRKAAGAPSGESTDTGSTSTSGDYPPGYYPPTETSSYYPYPKETSSSYYGDVTFDADQIAALRDALDTLFWSSSYLTWGLSEFSFILAGGDPDDFGGYYDSYSEETSDGRRFRP